MLETSCFNPIYQISIEYVNRINEIVEGKILN